VDVRSFFIADAQAPPVEQPVEARFDDVAVLAKAAAVLAVAFGNHRDDAQGTQRPKDLVLRAFGIYEQLARYQLVSIPDWGLQDSGVLHEAARHGCALATH